ncbi:MAG TPA: UDP-N-acetylglucosamine pyrophosphorylase [Propionibacteriaceae bacterium]|nr:UDP-N-acetylglucosamine pyrophosphorylase [Propionibacteriaceae bacterium]
MSVVQALIDKGVRIVNPASVEIADDVDPERISGDGVVIHAGCRVRGASTVLSAGVELGAEGPVTLEDCRLGPGVSLKGGYAARAVFLEGANLGLGHHVREGTILEEEANGAHSVGLKQTILFPFVTLGSLINFCDLLMAGGTSRSDHSEVGSSYIHFNFTPSGDKTTPSLFGDVARGVLLRERPIFLGGQGGAVGPVRVAYGTVVGAGSIVRDDITTENELHLVAPPATMSRPLDARGYPKLLPMLAKNLGYLANLEALEAWYRQARAPFFAAQPLGDLVLEGALAALASARAERLARLHKLGGKLDPADPRHAPVVGALPALLGLFGARTPPASGGVLEPLVSRAGSASYVTAVKGLSDAEAAPIAGWLQGLVDERTAEAAGILPALG